MTPTGTDKLYWVRRIRMVEVEGDYRPHTYPAEPMTKEQALRADFLVRKASGGTSCYVVALSRMPLTPCPPAPHDEQPGGVKGAPKSLNRPRVRESKDAQAT